MKFEIKHRFTKSVLFSLETDSFKLCVEAAVKSGANLSGANLYCADLSGADLSGADLSGADLSRADLSRACLYCADLSGANLYCAADLSGADLSRADLSGADLSGADLSGANLYGACLYCANLYGAHNEKITMVGERPFLQLGPLGSRCAYLLAFLTDAGVYVRAGCFWNTLKAFKAAVKKTHGTTIHGKEYGAAIKLIEAHAKLWTPKKVKK